MEAGKEIYVNAWLNNHKSIPLEGMSYQETNRNGFERTPIFRAVSTMSGFESQPGEVAFKKACLQPVSLMRMMR